MIREDGNDDCEMNAGGVSLGRNNEKVGKCVEGRKEGRKERRDSRQQSKRNSVWGIGT